MAFIEYLKGKIERKENQEVVVDFAGFGFRVRVSSFTLSKLPPVGEEVFLWLEPIIREDSVELYGFSETIERMIFRTLQRVPGVGPSLALSIISSLSPSEFAYIIDHKLTDRLSDVPGLGKKRADRIILELDGKLPKISREEVAAESAVVNDAISALTSLGYNKSQARDIVTSVLAESPDISIEELIRRSLELT